MLFSMENDYLSHVYAARDNIMIIIYRPQYTAWKVFTLRSTQNKSGEKPGIDKPIIINTYYIK